MITARRLAVLGGVTPTAYPVAGAHVAPLSTHFVSTFESSHSDEGVANEKPTRPDWAASDVAVMLPLVASAGMNEYSVLADMPKSCGPVPAPRSKTCPWRRFPAYSVTGICSTPGVGR